ncbi:major histocompatibility complex class I-related gene protein-like isoform X2 [Eleutherodactylus coqui]|uniref:major histocompatibility complex class I-related gene protein-like isoform X2 n=1 Tax=Eleutherodactylus coqui TaxID=57060 RepID=UPI0034637FCD
MKKMSVLTLILLNVSRVFCYHYPLRVLYIGVSAPGSGIPELSRAVYVDDLQAELYNSDIGRVVPVAPWMNKMGPEYWESETKIIKEDEALFRHEVKLMMKALNQTEGFHFVQVFTACKLRDDNSSEGFLKYTYDGNQSMYLDVPTATYIPTMPGAEIATQRWNSPSIRMGEIHKKELENICVERLVRFTDHGREYLERKVRPGVKVMRREPGEVTMLHCLVYGFYPRAVDVKWMKNRTDEVPTYQTTHVLPNPDGTYQIRVSVEVIPQEGDSYSCYVDHSSLEEPLLVDWDPEQEVPLSVIISVGVISVLVLIAVVVGVVIYRKKKNNYMAAGDHL